MLWPTLAIVIITTTGATCCARRCAADSTRTWRTTARALVIADDGSDDGTAEMLAGVPRRCARIVQPAAWGANANAGVRAALARADYVLQLRTTCTCSPHLDMHPHIERLRDDPTCGFIRLWGVGGHRYEVAGGQTSGACSGIATRLYIPSDRPHVKHRRFHEHYGLYPEGTPTAHTEEAWCPRPEPRRARREADRRICTATS